MIRTHSLVCKLALFATVATGCAVIDVQRSVPLNLEARWALLPVADHSDSSQAGERVETTLSTLMKSKLNVELTPYPAATPPAPAGKIGEAVPELDDRQRYEQALAWTRKEGFVYGVTGSVNEWRYRSGADGEAAVGLTIQVVDLASGRTLWSGSGSRSGWGRETASGTAQKLLRDLLSELAKKPGK